MDHLAASTVEIDGRIDHFLLYHVGYINTLYAVYSSPDMDLDRNA